MSDVIGRLEADRAKAIKWANQSVGMLQDAFFPVADALRELEAYLRNTPHHNAIEAAAARKALAVFDAANDGSSESERLRKALATAADEFDLILMRLRDDQPERAEGAAICGAKDARAALTARPSPTPTQGGAE